MDMTSTFHILYFALIMLLMILCVQVCGTIKFRQRKELRIKTLLKVIVSLKDNTKELAMRNEWLITEMHHRVKNNLQILSSLTNAQLSFITDKIGRDALFSSKHRLYALSLVHQRLVNHATASTIEMTCCIKDLVAYLRNEFEAGSRVKFKLDLVPLSLDMSFAIPFELILNELITNSLKYAFPEDRRGNINISLSVAEPDNFQLVYADDGVGLPEKTAFLSGRSLGRSLIMGLAHQIRGQITVNRSEGLMITIDFKLRRTDNLL